MSTNSSQPPSQDAGGQQARSTSATPAPAAAATATSTTTTTATTTTTSATQQPQPTASIIAALSSAFKSSTGESLQNDKIASLLLANMEQITALERQGRLTHAQIMQLKEFALNNNKEGASAQAVTQTATVQQPTIKAAQQPVTGQPMTSTMSVNAMRTPLSNGMSTAMLGASASPAQYPISSTLSIANPGPQSFPAATGRPTLSGGFASGRISGTPAQIQRTDDPNSLGSADTSNRRKNTQNDQSMRRTIQDLVFSIDPNVKIEPEVEDLLLDIADEFIDSVTNFGCRLAKHRGGDSLEVRDLQLHLERNHNIRIPGFASDETRISISQSSIAPVAGGGTTSSSNKKSQQNANVTLRGQRLAQVAQAKKEAKLV